MNLSEMQAIDSKHFMPVYGERLPVAFARGEGVTLYDTEGNAYTDFLAGIAVNALGYSDDGYKNAIKAQIDALMFTSNYFYNEPQAKLEQALCERTGMDRVFFANSGAEANECALKLAKKRAHMKGSTSANFVSLKNSFHGRTLLTLSATGQESFHTPFNPGAYSHTYVQAGDAEALSAVVNDETCGVIIELIQGEGGVLPIDVEYVRAVRKLCDKHGALLIIDEIQTGMGRTGTFLACEQYGVQADVVTLAKALGNGVPIGACLATEQAASAFTVGDHGTTFGGSHFACAAGNYVVNAIDEAMLGSIREKGEYFKANLDELMERKPDSIIDVRGMGLILGVQLADNLSVADVKAKLLKMGFVIGTASMNTLRFLPPYIIKKSDIDALITLLKEVV